jgi:hypothetical protein
VGAKKFDTLHDFARHGFNIHLSCANGHCGRTAVLDAWQVYSWARVWRWPIALEAGVMRHFYCSACRARYPTPMATLNAVTLIDFFPDDERGWQRLRQRIRR